MFVFVKRVDWFDRGCKWERFDRCGWWLSSSLCVLWGREKKKKRGRRSRGAESWGASYSAVTEVWGNSLVPRQNIERKWTWLFTHHQATNNNDNCDVIASPRTDTLCKVREKRDNPTMAPSHLELKRDGSIRSSHSHARGVGLFAWHPRWSQAFTYRIMGYHQAPRDVWKMLCDVSCFYVCTRREHVLTIYCYCAFDKALRRGL